MSETIFARVKFKRRTTAGWATKNEVLAVGEPGIEVLVDGSEKIKYGDGIKTWSQLSYAAGGGGAPSAHKTSHATGGTDALTPGDIGADPAGAAAAAVSAHLAASDPHPGYTTAQEAAAAAPVQSVAGKTGAVTLARGDVGLADVDNTSDLNKPISTATATALAGKADLVGGVIPGSQLPALSISEYLGTVASQAAMLDLTGQRGDWAIRSDRSRAWILSGDDASQIGNWVELPTPVDAITSVNGQTGVIVLGAGDVGAAPAAQGVSNGNSHNHDGGDGAQIAYNTLSGLPTIFALSDATPQAPGTASAGNASAAARGDHRHPLQETWPWLALGDPTTSASQGIKQTIRYWPRPFQLTAIPLWESSAPVGSALQLDIRVNGTSIFSTLPTIAVGGVSSTATTPAVFAAAFVSAGQTIAVGSTVTFHVIQAPSGGGGAGLIVTMPGFHV